MCDLPETIIRVLRPFEPVFSGRVWPWAQALLVGAILTPGPRTVAAALRVLGLQDDRSFQNYHRVLNRARWSSRALSPILLRLLVRTFVAAGDPVLVGLDDTIERRRGAKIAAKGIYRDPVRSSKGHFVKASGLRGSTPLKRGHAATARAGGGVCLGGRPRRLGGIQAGSGT